MKETKPSAADYAGLIRRDCGPEKDVADVCVREYARTAAGVTDFGLASAAVLYLALFHLGLHTRILMGHVVTDNDYAFQHIWCEAERRVFDVSVYPATASPFCRWAGIRPVMPQVNRAYGDTDAFYHRDTFRPGSALEEFSWVYGMPLTRILDAAPEPRMVETAALRDLSLPVTEENIGMIRAYAEGYQIGHSYRPDKPVV